MKELITIHQANLLMLALLIAAPAIGVMWGGAVKKIGRGALVGLLIGAGNYALWTVYNAITDRLGLDTVKNLVTNLALFIAVGAAAGFAAAWFGRRRTDSNP
ncbi:hypothetical protein CCAX7_35000 [Capsulimonas corticalis]|uniref:Uncharacterized protein n=1 Tax=Capsulimonas corticalis TaxID=2219043 RepID=A0A402CY53_9BACT|nr:hypothetical protein [Capsulimonas corticalis]BDI31449.1 hypothetical protein CCAX7_35000 [Capsulimonas corticalis]